MQYRVLTHLLVWHRCIGHAQMSGYHRVLIKFSLFHPLVDRGETLDLLVKLGMEVLWLGWFSHSIRSVKYLFYLWQYVRETYYILWLLGLHDFTKMKIASGSHALENYSLPTYIFGWCLIKLVLTANVYKYVVSLLLLPKSQFIDFLM